MVEVASQVDLLLRCQRHHLSGMNDVVGEGLLHENVLAGFHGLDGRLVVPAAVLGPAGANIDDIQIGLTSQHFGQTVVGTNAILCGGVVCSFLDHVTNSYQLSKRVSLVGLHVWNSNSPDAHNPHLQRHNLVSFQ
jgi:hypothetical protein